MRSFYAYIAKPRFGIFDAVCVTLSAVVIAQGSIASGVLIYLIGLVVNVLFLNQHR